MARPPATRIVLDTVGAAAVVPPPRRHCRRGCSGAPPSPFPPPRADDVPAQLQCNTVMQQAASVGEGGWPD